jgi:DNA (cytosine-5)-methyltransferase 1
MKPRLLDLFCGSGGAAMGYYRAGFEVVGVDIKPQPHFPFEFHQADALTYPLDGFDAYHASPPCQHATHIGQMWRMKGYKYPTLIEPIRELLQIIDKPYVIENVVGAKLLNPIRLSGGMFKLGVKRQRLFECNFEIPMYFEVKNSYKTVMVCGHASTSRDYEDYRKWPNAMGIDWMTKQELTQAIPPTYTEYIGKYLMEALNET